MDATSAPTQAVFSSTPVSSRCHSQGISPLGRQLETPCNLTKHLPLYRYKGSFLAPGQLLRLSDRLQQYLVKINEYMSAKCSPRGREGNNYPPTPTPNSDLLLMPTWLRSSQAKQLLSMTVPMRPRLPVERSPGGEGSFPCLRQGPQLPGGEPTAPGSPLEPQAPG